jgi:hypothetical protein
MPLAMLVTIVAMTLTASLVPVLLHQFAGTRTVDARTVSLDAAQTGLDVALGQLRAASAVVPTPEGDSVVGILEELPPCTMTGSQDSGGLQDTEAQAGILRYRVTIAYYGLPDNAVDTTPALLSCPPPDVPKTAVLTATGTGSKAAALTAGSPDTRTIEATYTFKTTNANINGGAIKQIANPPATNELCMDARVPPGVTMQNCVPGIPSYQRFAYTPELNIQLIGSETGTAPDGLCLDAPLPHKTGDPVVLLPCLGRNARQQWSLDDNSRFQGTNDGVSLDGLCLSLEKAWVPGPLLIGRCAGTPNMNIFRPQAGVGAGMASAETRQLVNYEQFSRCLDVTNHNADWSYMIVWFCKQAPDGTVSWNQQWDLPPVSLSTQGARAGRIRTFGAGNPGQCLRTPDAITGYVTMDPCTASNPLTDQNDPIDEHMKWVVYGDTGDTTSSYRIMDMYGRCLTPTALQGPGKDTHTDGTAKVKVAPCDGSELQKWNAPPDLNAPLALSNTVEK